MSRFAVLCAVGLAGLVMVVTLPSCGVLGGPPGNVQIQADTTGAGVVLLWTSPREGPPDLYAVYFTPLGGTEVLVAEMTGTTCFHTPESGMTGTYRVEARFGADAYSAAERPSTVPVLTDTFRLYELNVPDEKAGFGWSRTTGRGSAYDMRQAGNAPHVDFYLTDTRQGHNSRPYALFSPDTASHRKDQGAAGVIPTADWKQGWFTDHRPDQRAILPEIDPAVYFDYTDIAPVPFNAGCWLPDGHFALVRVIGVDHEAGYADMVAWFQMVPGLRLIWHE